jgi:predicted amidophosphoribosyltransferase
MNHLKGAFVVDPLKSATLRDQHVVLVDDVMTTGASLQMAAKALQAAGVAHLTTLVFARTENADHD